MDYVYSISGELLSVSYGEAGGEGEGEGEGEGGIVYSYAYDALGRRVAKSVDEVVQEKYLWGEHNQRLLAVYDGTDVLQMHFEYAGGRLPVAVEILTGGNAGRYYLHYDQVGSLRVVTDEVGVIVKTVEYDSFGNVTADSAPTIELPIGFAGGFLDADTGLLLFGYRDYDPRIGRWLARDPIGFAGGDTNLWAYCGNDPVGYYDSNGLNPVAFFGGIGAAVGVGLYIAEVVDIVLDIADVYNQANQISNNYQNLRDTYYSHSSGEDIIDKMEYLNKEFQGSIQSQVLDLVENIPGTTYGLDEKITEKCDALYDESLVS